MRQNHFSLLALGCCGILLLQLGKVPLRAEDPVKSPPKETGGEEQPAKPEPKQTLAKKPKPLSEQTKHGIEFLIKQQLPNGSWSGGPKAAMFEPKIGGKSDAIDVANTSIASLALLRAGYSPKSGAYSANLRKAINAVLKAIEDSDKDTLALKTTSPTQVQRKIGDNVDTYLSAILLANAKGLMPDAATEQRLEKALQKIVDKMEANQKDDGTWNGQGWAPVFSQAMASRAINLAKQAGMAVDSEKLEKTAQHARDSFKKLKFSDGVGVGGGGKSIGIKGRPVIGLGVGVDGTAGIDLYGAAAAISAMQDAVNTHRVLGTNSQTVLRSNKTTDKDREAAKKQLRRLDEHEKALQDALRVMAKKAGDPNFTRGFGSDGGEEFLSFSLISEALLANQMREFREWDKAMTNRLVNAQNSGGSWSGMHCISGETFCTATALMTMMSDRAHKPAVSELVRDTPPASATKSMANGGDTARIDLPDPKVDDQANGKPVGEPERLLRELLGGGADRDEILKKLRDTKGAAYTDALAGAAARLEGDDQKEARNALTSRLTRMTANTLRRLLQDDDRELRRAAALACAMKVDKSHVPDLISLLNDADPVVLRAGRAALKSLAGGEDFGPEPDAAPAEKAKAILGWRNWWNKHNGNR